MRNHHYGLLALPLWALLLNACVSDQAQYAARVTTALPQEVSECRFLGSVDAHPRATIENARFDLQVAAGRLGATHVVELYAYAAPLNRLARDMQGIGLTGRAYLCQEGKGPTYSKPEAFKTLPYDLPHPEVNNDDPFYHLFY